MTGVPDNLSRVSVALTSPPRGGGEVVAGSGATAAGEGALPRQLRIAAEHAHFALPVRNTSRYGSDGVPSASTKLMNRPPFSHTA